MEELVAAVDAKGVYCTADPAKFYPSPIGALIGPPSLRIRGLGAVHATVSVQVVCAAALTPANRDALWEAALAVADALGVDQFEFEGWAGPNDSDMPSYRLEANVHYSN